LLAAGEGAGFVRLPILAPATWQEPGVFHEPSFQNPGNDHYRLLGAGKTTLIRHLLENANGRRLALIINEFGDIGIDADILNGCGDLTCGAENYHRTRQWLYLLHRRRRFLARDRKTSRADPLPDHIVIETSGLALPKPLVKAFDWPAIRARLTVDGVIAVVDGKAVADGRFADDPVKLARQREADPSIAHDNPLEEVFEDQVLCADLVVLNKSDLIDLSEQRRIAADIAALVPRAVKSCPPAKAGSTPQSCSASMPPPRTILPRGHRTMMD